MRRIVRLSVVRNERQRAEAKDTRRYLFACARQASKGDNFAGFALVTWDMDGDMATAFHGAAPISAQQIPEQCRDALQRHLAAKQARNPRIIDPYDKGA